MAQTQIPSRTWLTGVTGPLGPVSVPANVDSIDVDLLPDTADWLTDAALPFELRREVTITVEQQISDGSWVSWASATFRTGSIPRTGRWTFGITDGDGRRTQARLWVAVTAPTVFGMSADATKRGR